MGLAADSIDAVAERLVEVDGGLECPEAGNGCKSYSLPVLESCLPDAQLGGECPVHGRFWVDVRAEYEEELQERIEDVPFQEPNDVL